MLKSPAIEKLKLLPLLIVLTVIACTLLSSDQATVAQQASAEDEQCIRCHVEVYNSALKQTFIHFPFFERQCRSCHQGKSEVNASMSTSSLLTGLLVDQQPLWRKQQQFGGELSLREHFVTLNNLEPQALYRFRLQVAEQTDQPFATSSWLGLRLAELTNSESREMLVTQGLDGPIGQTIAAVKIQLVAADTVMISWQTVQPLSSWLELQLLEEAQPTALEAGTAETQATHPALREPDRTAINACYTCHPETNLGNSHPVRLYSGRDVKIPEDLPTVDGMLTCVTCHDPHGAPGKMLLRQTIKTQLCVTCHYKYKNSSPSTMFRD